MAGRRAPGEKRWQLVRWYVQEGRFRVEERTLTAFQWLYTPQQHRILSRADLQSPSRRYGRSEEDSYPGPMRENELDDDEVVTGTLVKVTQATWELLVEIMDGQASTPGSRE